MAELGSSSLAWVLRVLMAHGLYPSDDLTMEMAEEIALILSRVKAKDGGKSETSGQ